MKTKTLIIVACILYAVAGFAQVNQSVPQSFNTAISTGYGGVVGLFNPDVSWRVARGFINNTYNPAIQVTPGGGSPVAWGAGNSISQWISTNYGCSGSGPANHGCLPGVQDLYFRINFTLTTPVFTTKWKIFSDNTVEEIFVNSMSSPVLTPQTGNWTSGIDFNWCSNWVTGPNYIIIHVRSGPSSPPNPDWAGMMVQSTAVTPINISGPTTICPNTTNGYSIPTVPGAWSYAWTVPTGWTTPSSSNVISTTSSTNSGLITVNVNGPTGCMGSASLPVTVLPTPTINVTPASATVCPNTPVILTASGANSYTWAAPVNSNNSQVTVSPGSTTVYTVTGTGSNGCIGKKTVTITVLPLPPITINAVPPFICPGVSNTLTASGGTSYTWMPSGIQSTSIVVSPVTTTTYGVVGTGTNGCVKTTTITLSPGQSIPITAPNVTLCTNASLCATLTASSTISPVSFTWVTVGTGPTVNVCPTVNTIYTVSATSSGGCASSTTMAVTITTNCCSQSTVGLTPLSGVLGGTYSNQSYFLENSITVTSSTTFQDAEVRIMPGVQITVAPNNFLALAHAHFYACGINMWQGISIDDMSQFFAYDPGSGSTFIEDAVIGVDISNITVNHASTVLSVQDAIFNKNYIDIQFSNSQPAVTSLPVYIYRSVFTSRDIPFSNANPFNSLSWPSTSSTASNGLRVPYSATATQGLPSPYNLMNWPFINLKAPYNTQQGEIGIKINNIGNQSTILPTQGVEINPPNAFYTNGTADYNLFDGIRTGIDVTDASLVTHNNVFQNINAYQVGSSWFGGTGVYQRITGMMNAQLDLGPDPNFTSGNKFWNCWGGVQTQNVFAVNIQNAVFRSDRNVGTGYGRGSDGVLLFSNRFTYNILNNEFNNIDYSIYIDNQNGPYDIGGNTGNGTYADKININQNYIGPEVNSSTFILPGTEYSNRAITLKGINAGAWQLAGNCNIFSNKINRAYRAIRIQNMDAYRIEVGGNEILLKDDYVVEPSADQWGIYANDSKDNLVVSQNTVTGEGNASGWNGRMRLIRSINNQSAAGSQFPQFICNVVTDGFIGFEFDGPQLNTVWNNNNINQKMFKGLSLVNGGAIGVQGSPMLSSGNMWSDNFNTAPNIWASNWQTYVDASSPAAPNSFIWGTSPPVGLPSTNGTAGPPPFTMGPSLGKAQMGAECTSPTNYPTPPSQRLMSQDIGITGQTMAGDWNVDLYPNPSSDNITIKALNNDVVAVKIIDVTGKIIYSKNITGDNNNTINISELKSAIYLVEIQNKNNEVVRKKLVKVD